MSAFTYITHEHIDKKRWDERIASASNGLVYAYSWFLDCMSPGWDALIAEDYRFVMPLTWRRKFGITYLYQPAFAAQLGLFGDNISDQLMSHAVASIPKKFRLIEISLNEQNKLPAMHGVQHSTNYLLNLNSTAASLKKQFRPGTSRNIIQSQEAGNSFVADIPVEAVLDLMLMKMATVSNINKDDARRFHQLFRHAAPHGLAKTFGVYSKDGMLLSSTVILHSHQRVYYLMAGNHPEGRKTYASHGMINGILEQYAGTPRLFDFEGSDIPGVAMFFENFGAYAVQYPKLRVNRLPAMVNWLRTLS